MSTLMVLPGVPFERKHASGPDRLPMTIRSEEVKCSQTTQHSIETFIPWKAKDV